MSLVSAMAKSTCTPTAIATRVPRFCSLQTLATAAADTGADPGHCRCRHRSRPWPLLLQTQEKLGFHWFCSLPLTQCLTLLIPR